MPVTIGGCNSDNCHIPLTVTPLPLLGEGFKCLTWGTESAMGEAHERRHQMTKSLRQSLELNSGTEEQKGREEFQATARIMSLPWGTTLVQEYVSHMESSDPEASGALTLLS